MVLKTIKVLVVVVIWLLPVSVNAQTSPTLTERATVATLFASSSVSMVPVWLTAACTTEGTCREINPVMRKLIGAGPIRTATFKATISGLTHYAIWQMPSTTTRQKLLRVTAAVILLGINGLDAVHDIRVFRQLDRER